MPEFAVYELDSGRLVSLGTVVADPLPSHLAARELSPKEAADIRRGGVWDEGTATVIPPIPAIPASVTARQARLWLVRRGIDLAAVDAAIASIPDAVTRESVRVEWEYGTEVHRNSEWLAALGPALGLDAATLDAAFREAAGL